MVGNREARPLAELDQDREVGHRSGGAGARCTRQARLRNSQNSRGARYERATETFFYRDITDIENNATIHTGEDLKSKTRQDHGVLKVTTT
jgi:hypothetical protein